ncbi:MAG: hypothetical protein RL228_343 [Actinomycetota bacterium]
MNWLSRFESELAALWRVWLQISRMRNLAWSLSPQNLIASMRVFTMFRNGRLFWKTNRRPYLEKAVGLYFQLQTGWKAAKRPLEILRFSLEGWLSAEMLESVRTAFPNVKVKHSFRPDIWYITAGKVGLFSGIKLSVDSRDSMALESYLVKSGVSGTASDPVKTYETFQTSGFILSSHPVVDGKQFGWTRALVLNPKLFCWLIEATIDREMATVVASYIARLPYLQFDAELTKCLAILNLVSDSKGSLPEIPGWTLRKISNPAWNYSSTFSQDVSARVSPKYFVLDDLSVVRGGLLFHDSQLINWDTAQHPSLDFIAGLWDVLIGTHANLNYCYTKNFVSGEDLSEGILLTSRADSNWFHFLIETLPRIFLLEDVGIPTNVPILISDRVSMTGEQALRLLSNRRIIRIHSSEIVKISTAYVPGPTIYHPDTQFMWNNYKSEYINFELLETLRERILQKLEPLHLATKTYWPRVSAHRQMRHGKWVEKALRRRGFENLNPGEMSFQEQVSSIYSARVLIAVGGALMANFIFAKPEAKIAVLISKFGLGYSMPIDLARVSGVKVTLIGGRERRTLFLDSITSRAQAGFSPNVFRLLKWVRQQKSMNETR